MRALSDVASMTGREPVPQASGECDPSGLSPNACRFCSVKVPGYDSPHSTHKVSAIRPETSSKKQWGDKEIVLVAMVGQANHCIQQHVALAQLPLGAHRGVPDEGAFYQERGQGFKVVVLRRRSPPQI